MKTIIALLTCLALTAAAQTFTVTNLQISATLTNGPNPYTGTNFVWLERNSEVGFQLSFAGAGTNDQNITVAFVRSWDGTNYETTPQLFWPVAINTTSPVVAGTNFNLGTARAIMVSYVTNAGYYDATNAELYGLVKSYRRD